MRRGGAPALVLCLYLALGSVLLAAVSLAAMSNAAAERDYRRSQAVALAEAGVAEARVGGKPHDLKTLGAGRYAWTAEPANGGQRIRARGEVLSAAGAVVTRSVTVLLLPDGKWGRIAVWEEGP